jgi:hypothetical protein
MSLIRGVLLAGKFRTHHELNGMSHEDQRNTLIVELSNRSNQKNFQAFNDVALADAGAALVFLRTARIRDDAQLKTISIDDMRNILIVEIGAMTGMGQELQGLSNIDLVLLGLGKPRPGGLNQGSFIRGVLLAGKFRTQHELNRMSADDQRNTLIVELTARSNQSNFQSFNDFDLAGMGAVVVFLREARIRNDAQLKTISIDDMRNILIVEIDGQTHFGSRLQSLSNMDLVRLGLGVDPAIVFKPLPPPLQPPARFGLDLKANPDHLQINPELVILGHGFTGSGRFHYTIHNWPKVQDIHNQGALEFDGSFKRTESRGFASIPSDVDVPDIEVTAVDEATGRSVTASVSAEKFVVRFS